jgi:hypothetical protein
MLATGPQRYSTLPEIQGIRDFEAVSFERLTTDQSI